MSIARAAADKRREHDLCFRGQQAGKSIMMHYLFGSYEI
jgi:hypothetical protein